MRLQRIIGTLTSLLLISFMTTEAAYASSSELPSDTSPEGTTYSFTPTSGVSLQVTESNEELSADQLKLIPGQITCTLRIPYPHGSTHVTGTVNVTADTKCEGPAPYSIHTSAILYKLPNYAYYGSSVTVYSKSFASVACR